jgi:tetratricopeptide (TPR) repeat protein
LKTKALSFGLDPGIIGDDGRVVNESLLPPALRGQNLPPARILTSLAHFYASDLEKKAETARREGKTEEAERYLARARSLVDAGLEVDPTHAASHRKIAAWKATEGKAQEAKAHLETAERLEENQSSEKYKLGFDPKANPVVGGLYEALADEGIPNGSLNQGTEGQKDLVIKGGEVLDYVGRNLDDPRVRRALAAVGIAIPKGLEAAIREKGFGKAMAEHHAARAVALSQQGGSKNIQPAAEQLTLAACYEPENPARFAAVGDFYAEHDRHFLAFNMFAAAQQISKPRETPPRTRKSPAP